MNFGEGFKRVETTNSVECGIHDAVISKCTPKQWQSGNWYVEVEFVIDGEKDCYPNKYNFNDSPKRDGQSKSKDELMHIWCQTATRFFDNFGIKSGDFRIETWIGAKGKITVRQQKNKPQYKEIVPYELKGNFNTPTVETATVNPAPVQAVASAFGGAVQPNF